MSNRVDRNAQRHFLERARRAQSIPFYPRGPEWPVDARGKRKPYVRGER